MARSSLKCQWCGKNLVRRQQRWCSGRCATRRWYKDHPEVYRNQLRRFYRRHRSSVKREHQKYYRDNKQYIRKRQDAYDEKNWKRLKMARSIYMKGRARAFRIVVREAKDKPCIDCGKRYPYYVMDLDHVRGRKLCDPAALYNKAKSMKRLKRELKKCEPVCSNCHRERTQQAKMSGRLK